MLPPFSNFFSIIFKQAIFSAVNQFIISSIVHTDQRYITALTTNNVAVVKEIYAQYAYKVKYYILANNGDEDDAADIFQEVLTDLYNQATHKQLQLTCPFEPFLLLLCKRKWLNELKKRGRHPVTKDIEDVYIGEDVFAQAEVMQQQEQKMQAFWACFEKLGSSCKEILKHSLEGSAQEEIAALLKVSYGYLRKKKSECMATLTKMIHSQLSGKQ